VTDAPDSTQMTTTTEALSRNLEEYDRLSAEEVTHFAMQHEKIERIAGLLTGLRGHATDLADIGAFTGWATERYAQAAGAERVTCFDLSDAALRHCAKRGFATALWNCEQPSPAEDGAFTTIVAADLIEHLVNTDSFVTELHRMLRPGGVLIISTPNLAYWLNRVRLAAGRTPWSYPGVSSTFRRSPTIDLNHLRINVPAEWVPFVEAGGFRLMQRTGYSIFKVWATTRWGRLRTRLDELADRRAPDLAFGNICVFERGGSM
jgi:2-polyprenyl-3-methyl-5-hydroxy-6-metoxy-1,4-benzoquinol methylase